MALVLLLLFGCRPKTAQLAYELVSVHPHDVACFTQGLEFEGEVLLESGGQYGESKLRRVNPKNGAVIQERRLPAQIFAEGLTLLDDEIWLLTWKAGKVYVFDAQSFELRRTFAYKGEGWGLCTDGKNLIMSNGSNMLFVRSPKDFSLIEQIAVMRGGREQEQLNELEFVNGIIYANIYQKDEIVRIDAKSGEVTGVIDLSDLRKKLSNPKGRSEALNGIARHPKTGHFWVTGKYWSEMFEIELK